MDTPEVLHIISRIRSGESDAFRVLVREYKEMVFSLALKMVRQQEDAEEVSQDTFLKAFKSIGTFRGQAKFSTWLYQIGYFTSINFLRKRKVKIADVEWPVVADDSPGALEQLESAERSRQINAAISRLRPDERGIVSMYYFDQMSTEEIAMVTSLSLTNVKVKIHRCRQKLHGILSMMMKNELTSAL